MSRHLAALLSASALLIGACGDDEDGGGGGERLSKAEFSEQGAKICRDGAIESKRVAERELSKPEVQRLDRVSQQLAALDAAEGVTRATVDRLGDLRPPEDLEEAAEKLGAGILGVFDVIDDLEAAAKDRDREKVTEVTTRLAELTAETRRHAEAAGLAACLPENTP